MTRSNLGVAALSAAALLAGCSRSELSGPPELRLGRDECGECGMIVSEDRCSSALLVENEGVREHVVFDDIGCMLDYERDRAGRLTRVDGFVHDHGTREWVRAAEARFLMADREKLPTPMGSGIVAFAGAEAAAAKQREVGGEVMDYARLAEARREWARARSAAPGAEEPR